MQQHDFLFLTGVVSLASGILGLLLKHQSLKNVWSSDSILLMLVVFFFSGWLTVFLTLPVGLIFLRGLAIFGLCKSVSEYSLSLVLTCFMMVYAGFYSSREKF